MLDPGCSPELLSKLNEGREAWEGYDTEGVNRTVAQRSTVRKSIWQLLAPKYRVQIGPRYQEFLERFSVQGLILELGGGPSSISIPGVINLDVNNYPTVDIIGDARRLPFVDNAFGAIICNSVLEHIWEVDLAISEVLRTTRKGGLVFFCVPLVCGRHHTIDYHRWTIPGLLKLFEQFEILEKGTILGPGMFVTHLATSMIESTLGRGVLSNCLVLAVAWMLFPLRFLDRLGKGSRAIEDYAHTIYVIGRKQL